MSLAVGTNAKKQYKKEVEKAKRITLALDRHYQKKDAQERILKELGAKRT